MSSPIYIDDGDEDQPLFSQDQHASQNQEFGRFPHVGKFEESVVQSEHDSYKDNIPLLNSIENSHYGSPQAGSFALPSASSANQDSTFTSAPGFENVHPQRRSFVPLDSNRARVSVPREAPFDFGSGAPLPSAKPRRSATNYPTEDAFDFGSGASFPSAAKGTQRPVHSYERQRYEDDPSNRFQAPPRKGSGNFQSLWENRDSALLSYLAARKVSPKFLVEIDIILENHPEILPYAPAFSETFNTSTPLQAYLFFVKGYTRPARYLAGTLPEHNFQIPALLPRLATAYDEELISFFGGYEYRYDILERIDEEVARLYERQCRGEVMTYDQRTLVTYVAFGNPVDAYKQFEYNYQTDWLPHRYLPEHVVLSELPAYSKKPQPVPRTDTSIQSQYDDLRTTHLFTRRSMAAANDAGVDVINVLLDDFTAKLVKKGCSRNTVMKLEEEARRAIDEQREHGLGDDIVDLVMDMANNASGRRALVERRSQKLRRAANGAPMPQQRIPRPPPPVIKPTRAQMHAPIAKMLPVKPKKATFPIGSVRDLLRRRKRHWERLEHMERYSTRLGEEQRHEIIESRRRAERSFVQALVQLLRAENKIDRKTADELNTRYSKKNQVASEEAGWRMDIMRLCPADI